MLRISGILLFLVFNSNLLAQEYSGNGEDLNIILSNIKGFSKAYVASDFNKLTSYYSTDAKIFPPGTEIIKGKADILKRWILPKGVDVVYHNIIPKEIKVLEDTAYDYGIYEGSSKDNDGNTSSWRGKYVIVWKKVDNDWKIYLDIWNRITDNNN